MWLRRTIPCFFLLFCHSVGCWMECGCIKCVSCDPSDAWLSSFCVALPYHACCVLVCSCTSAWFMSAYGRLLHACFGVVCVCGNNSHSSLESNPRASEADGDDDASLMMMIPKQRTDRPNTHTHSTKQGLVGSYSQQIRRHGLWQTCKHTSLAHSRAHYRRCTRK